MKPEAKYNMSCTQFRNFLVLHPQILISAVNISPHMSLVRVRPDFSLIPIQVQCNQISQSARDSSKLEYSSVVVLGPDWSCPRPVPAPQRPRLKPPQAGLRKRETTRPSRRCRNRERRLSPLHHPTDTTCVQCKVLCG